MALKDGGYDSTSEYRMQKSKNSIKFSLAKY